MRKSLQVFVIFVGLGLLYHFSIADGESNNCTVCDGVKPDPVVMQTGGIVVRRSQLAVPINEVAESKSVRRFNFDSVSSAGDEAYNEVMRKAERIARDFQESKVTGIYKVKLIVSGSEYEIWKQYQRDISKVFEKHLQEQIEEGASKLEVILQKAIGGNGESDTDVVVETDQKLGKVDRFSLLKTARIRGGNGGLKLIVDFVDRNLTPDSRTTVSYLQGANFATIRARHNVDFGIRYFDAAPGFTVLRCDALRTRNAHFQQKLGSDSLPMRRYETKVGCELEWSMK